MINKLKLIAASSVFMLFSAISFAAGPTIDSFAIGGSVLWGAYEANGSETVATSKQTDSGEIEVVLGSVFAEVDMGQITLGLDYIPFEAESETVTNVRADTVTSGTNTAYVIVKDHVTLYALIPIGDSGLYAKAGVSEMTVVTKENLATGGAYNDVDVNGKHIGIGYETDTSSDMFMRVHLDWHDYDEASATNTNTTNISVKADLDGYSAGISIGRRF